MTKKDYVALAAAFVLTRPLDRNVLGQGSERVERSLRNQWISDRDAGANALAGDNPRLRYGTFIEATEA